MLGGNLVASPSGCPGPTPLSWVGRLVFRVECSITAALTPSPRLCIGRAALSLGQAGQVESAGGRPFAGQGRLYSTPAALFVHQPGNWTFITVEQVPY